MTTSKTPVTARDQFCALANISLHLNLAFHHLDFLSALNYGTGCDRLLPADGVRTVTKGLQTGARGSCGL